MYGIFSENVRYCTVFLLGVYGTMYGICVKPPWPPCKYKKYVSNSFIGTTKIYFSLTIFSSMF